MKSTFSVRATKGFTLIELLIVIALIGALAVGLLATIDPFEQLKKGRDTAVRNTVAEFFNANLRYYANKGYFPWGSGSTLGVAALSNTDFVNTYVPELVAAGELKSNFMQLVGSNNGNRIYTTGPAPDQLRVCFQPESKSIQKDVNTIYSTDGTQTSGCNSQTSGTGGLQCFWCIQ